MNGTHLSDETIQAFALNELHDDAPAAAHLAVCEGCREAVASYRLMFTDIAEMPVSEFGFDVKTMVLSQLKAEKTSGAVAELLQGPAYRPALWAVMLIVAVAILIFAIVAYVFLKDLKGIFADSLPYLLYCIGPAAVLLLVWMVADMVQAYRRKMTQLEYY